MSTSSGIPESPIVWETKENIRSRFNESQILDRAESGEIRAKIWKDRHPAPPPPDHPECTRSRMIIYTEESGAVLALAHLYLRPDGTIGGSGRPDPKVMIIDGVVHKCETDSEP